MPNHINIIVTLNGSWAFATWVFPTLGIVEIGCSVGNDLFKGILIDLITKGELLLVDP